MPAMPIRAADVLQSSSCVVKHHGNAPSSLKMLSKVTINIRSLIQWQVL